MSSSGSCLMTGDHGAGGLGGCEGSCLISPNNSERWLELVPESELLKIPDKEDVERVRSGGEGPLALAASGWSLGSRDHLHVVPG